MTWDSEKECSTCFSQFGAWQEAGFPELHFPWKKCLGCRQSMCPRCWEVKLTMADHQPVCRAREKARKAKAAAEAAKVKAMAEAAAKAKATAEASVKFKPTGPKKNTTQKAAKARATAANKKKTERRKTEGPSPETLGEGGREEQTRTRQPRRLQVPRMHRNVVEVERGHVQCSRTMARL